MNTTIGEPEENIPGDRASEVPSSETSDTQDDSAALPSGRKRRIGAPLVLSFKGAIDMGVAVCQAFGMEGSQEAMAIKMGSRVTSSSFARMVVSFRRHNLFVLAGGTFSATEYMKALLLPESPEALTKARADAFLQDKLMKAVWDRMRGQVLPEDPTFVKNIIHKNDIPQEFVDGWYAYFFDGGKHAGLISEFAPGKFLVAREIESITSGIAANGASQGAETKDEATPKRESETFSPTRQTATDDPDFDQYLRLNYDGIVRRKRLSGGRTAYLIYPDEMTPDDAATLSRIFQAELEMLKAYAVDRS